MAPGTVRRALAELVSDGLLERFHGKGTFVRRPSFDKSLFRFFRFRGSHGESAVPASRILNRVVARAPSYVSARLGLDDGGYAISMTRIRLIDGEPVLVEEIWLPEARFAAFLEIPAEDVGPLLYPVYDAKCGQLIAVAEEALSAEAASDETAAHLHVDIGTPVMVIERLAKGYDGAALEWRRTRGRADQFHYRVDIQ